MRHQVEICGCFPTGRHYPGIADRLAATQLVGEVRGLAESLPKDLVWAQAAVAVIDFETTGLDPAVDRVLELGIVCFDDGVLSRSQNWLIHPTIPVPAESTAVHGISEEMLADKPRFEEIWAEAQPLLEGRIPVAYNASFDKRFLLAELERMSVPVWDPKLPPAMQSEVEWVDPLVWVRELQQGESAKLGEVCQRLGIPLDDAHRAANDAEATGKVLMALASQMPATYAELIRVQTRYAAQQDVDFAVWRGRRF